jgi:hypothetical protein
MAPINSGRGGATIAGNGIVPVDIATVVTAISARTAAGETADDRERASRLATTSFV